MRRLVFITSALVLFAFFLASSAEAQPKERLELRGAIEEALVDVFGPTVLTEVDVVDEDGVIILEGKVSTIRQHNRMVEVPKTIRGVIAVVDLLQVQPVQRDDGAIERDYREALTEHPALSADDVLADVDAGKIILRGVVQSIQMQRLAERLAAEIRGVAEVENRILIEYMATRSDEQIEQDVESRLASDILVDALSIAVEVKDAEVKLTGVVASAFGRSRAVADAWVTGTRAVDATRLEVWPGLRDEMRREAMPRPDDAALEEAIDQAIELDPRVENRVEVRAEEGIAVLRGQVDDLEGKVAAEEDAANTLGVLGVRNGLTVRPLPPVERETLAETVRRRLARDSDLSVFDIEAEVTGLTVELSGSVPSYFHKQLATEVVSQVDGVVAINNRLALLNEKKEQSDAEILAAIRSRFWWSPYVDVNQVSVRVLKGVAVLSGTVETWRERDVAGDIAREAGVRRVINEIEITGLR